MMSISIAQWFDWAVSVVNFSIMFFLFRLVVIVPMEQAVRLREQRVVLRLKEIEDIRVEAEAKKEIFQAKFGDVEAALADIKTSSERSLSLAKLKIDEKAASEERYVLEKAKVEAESMAREVEVEIRTKVASLAVERAEALLISALDAKAQNAIVAAAVKKVGVLNAS